MKFQKILCLVTLVVAALTFVYALSFFSTGLAELRYYTTKYGGSIEGVYNPINADKVYDYAQGLNDILLIMSIIFIVLAVTQYIAATNTRRKYYITNYISIGAIVLFAVVFAILALVMVSQCFNMYLNDINWSRYRALHKIEDALGFGLMYPYYSDSKLMFILGYVVFLLVILAAAAQVYNLIWKIKLMKGEKELLAKSAPEHVEEVA